LKAIVTGGAGFIGSHLVDLLLAGGHQVTVLDNLSTGRREHLARHAGTAALRIVETDVADLSHIQLHFAQADWVFHLAGKAEIVPSVERPGEYLRTNVDGTFAVLEASRHAGVKRFVYAASSSCYGIPDMYPTPETADIRPQYPYALTKLMGEELVLHWSRVYKLPAVSLRLFNAYGPRARTSGAYGAVFGVFLAQKLAGKPFTVVGDGNQTRDFVFVTDVAGAFLAGAKSDRVGEVYNVGAGKPQSVNRLVQLLGGDVVHVPKRPGEPDCTWADISKIRSHLGWEPTVSFDEGVAIMLHDLQYWRHAPVWEPTSIERATRAWFNALSGPR